MESSIKSENRLIIVSNRLPIVISKDENGNVTVERGSGGLVTAMAPVLKNRGGMWIGWPGNVENSVEDTEAMLDRETKSFGYNLKPVSLSQEEIDLYYKGFANEIIWPLFHDFVDHCNFNPDYFDAYQYVNEKFSQVIIKHLKKDDFIWVHDYHLMKVAKYLRDSGVRAKIAFFLHIPFPPPDVFVRLPWRFQILNALLEYDLIGFQTLRDRRNFLQCVRNYFNAPKVSGKGQVVRLRVDQRIMRVGVFPISIDFNEFAKLAATKEVSDQAWYIHEDLPEQKIVLGIDRLDYTKGIIERLQAFRNALLIYPDLRRRLTFIQVVVPSRRDIPQYADLKIEIERLIGEINGELTQSGWVPIHYIFRSLNRVELVSYYRTSEIALLTPLKDGMNLVAKEYCACNLEENGVLIMSEFAGATAQFQKGALLVNPHDIDGVAYAIHQAYHMPQDERRYRMKKLRQNVRKNDIFYWVDSFLEAAIAKNLNNFPVLDDYRPSAESDEAQLL